MIRKIAAVIVGLVSAVLIFLIAENLNAAIHPYPTTLDFTDSSAVETYFNNQPLLFWFVVLIGWAVGSFVCGLVSKAISKSNNKNLAYIAGGVLTLSGVANIFSLPHPTWFIIVGLLVFIPFVIAGHKIYKLKTTENYE